MDRKERIVIHADTDCSYAFKSIESIYYANPSIFSTAQTVISPLIKKKDNKEYFDDVNQIKLLTDTLIKKDSLSSFYLLSVSIRNEFPVLTQITDPAKTEIIKFTEFIMPPWINTIQFSASADKSLSISLKSLKEAILQRTIKNILIISDWLTKWSMYLHKEKTFSPQQLKAYKQGEVLLVDFGFNIGSELGGRHYAVVLEKDNSPKAGNILVAPISSYDPQKKQHPHPANVDLGIGAINNYSKGAQIVLNQTRYISKMRIERPKTSLEPSKRIPPAKVRDATYRIAKKLNIKV